MMIGITMRSTIGESRGAAIARSQGRKPLVGISVEVYSPARGDIALHERVQTDVAPRGAFVGRRRFQGLARLATRICLAGAVLHSLLAVLFCLACFVSKSAAAQPPNIILIIADDLGYGDLGCYGQRWIRTPRIDQLAADGVRFTQFYAGAPVCAPSRCTLMTGKHTGHAAIRNNQEKGPWKKLAAKYGTQFTGQSPLPDEETTLAELLHKQGYATAAIGKWGLGHLGTSGAPTQQGFDLFYGYYCQRHAHNHYPQFLWRNDQKETLPGNDGASLEGQTYSQDKFIENALAFIRDHRGGPFFLYVPLTVPHLSIQVPQAELAQYAGQIPEAPYKHQGYLKHPTPRAGYAAMISHMDRGVGQIVDLVQELNLDERTLILFTSDNGPVYDRLGGGDSDFFDSAGGLRGRKGSVYEGGLRVPLIARWNSAIHPGGETQEAAAMWDLLPTLCEAAGAEPPHDIDGVSLLKTLTDNQPAPERNCLYWEFPAYGGQQAVRAGNWKGLRTDLAEGPQRWQLYDLGADPAETFDVADDYPDIAERLATLAKAARVPSKLFPLKHADEPAPAKLAD
jgi:arylsulfatase A